MGCWCGGWGVIMKCDEFIGLCMRYYDLFAVGCNNIATILITENWYPIDIPARDI